MLRECTVFVRGAETGNTCALILDEVCLVLTAALRSMMSV
jgi:hypothetical protein